MMPLRLLLMKLSPTTLRFAYCMFCFFGVYTPSHSLHFLCISHSFAFSYVLFVPEYLGLALQSR